MTETADSPIPAERLKAFLSGVVSYGQMARRLLRLEPRQEMLEAAHTCIRMAKDDSFPNNCGIKRLRVSLSRWEHYQDECAAYRAAQAPDPEGPSDRDTEIWRLGWDAAKADSGEMTVAVPDSTDALRKGGAA